MKKLAAVLVSFAVTFVSASASADVTKLKGGCEFRGGADCSGSCSNISFEASCNIDLAVTCQGQCNVDANVSCTGSCGGTCEADCNVKPAEFSCAGHCATQCGGTCEAQCTESTSGATSKADCKAKCDTCCRTECEGSCTATPGSADCKTKCSASCKGECKGEANIGCQVDCQSKGSASCQATAKGNCSVNCNTNGMIVCDNSVKEFVKSLEDAKAWITAHVTYSGQASCTGNECKASGTLSCATSPATSDGLFAASIATAFAAFIAARRKKA